jgi:hypothetical protein
MDRPPQVNVLTIGDTSDGPTVLIRQVRILQKSPSPRRLG